jgi:hypothetical protein
MWGRVDILLTDVSEGRIASRRYVPPKRLLTKYLHDATSQDTAFFNIIMYTGGLEYNQAFIISIYRSDSICLTVSHSPSLRAVACFYRLTLKTSRILE